MKGDTHSGDSVRGTWDKAGTLRTATGAKKDIQSGTFMLDDKRLGWVLGLEIMFPY